MKKNELAIVLNDTLEVITDLAIAADKISKTLLMIPPIIGFIRTTFDIPDEPNEEDESEKQAEKPKKSTPKKKEPEALPEEPKAPAYTKADVRKYLAGVAEHHRDEVKALLTKYGADNLTQLDEKHYAAIMADAEEIANAK